MRTEDFITAWFYEVDEQKRARCLRCPEPTRLLRLFPPHQDWLPVFLTSPTGLGVLATEGSERIPPRRAGRSSPQMGRKGLSKHR